MLRKQESHHNTTDEVEGWLGAAVDLVERLEVPDDLRVAAFSAAVGLLAAKQIFYEQPTSALAMAIPRGV